MKIIVSSSQLLKNLQVLGSVINNSNTMPILDNFLFNFENDKLQITSSDLENTMTVNLKIDSSNKGSYCIPAKLLIEVLKTLPEQPITFSFSENNIAEITSMSGKYELAYSNANEFPKSVLIENASKTVLSSKVLSTAINKTIFATGTDDLRPVMTGVYFQLTTSGLIFTSTDAHKLVKYSRKDIKSDQDAFFIMPKKPLNVLKTVLSSNMSSNDAEVIIQYNETNASFTFDDFLLSSRLVDGKYPNYEAVIPKENPNKMTISRINFLSSVKRVSIFSNRQTHQIRLKIIGNELNLSSEDIDYSNKGDERLTCDYQGDDMQIGFNSRFLTEMLNNLTSDEIQLEMSEPQRAGILTPIDSLEDGEEILMLVMPVRID